LQRARENAIAGALFDNSEHNFAPLLFSLQASKIKHIKRNGRHSSVVEQLIRNQQAWGSNPHAGSREIKGLADEATPIFILGYHLG
jgi:hypothetical protein